MPRAPGNWPHGALPRLLTRAQAAYYVGLSPNSFDQLVRDGVYPKPAVRGRYDRHALDRALDRLSGLTPEQDVSVADPAPAWDIREPSNGDGQASRDQHRP